MTVFIAESYSPEGRSKIIGVFTNADVAQASIRMSFDKLGEPEIQYSRDLSKTSYLFPNADREIITLERFVIEEEVTHI